MARQDEVDQDELIAEIKATRAYEKYVEMVRTIKGGVDTAKLLEEAKGLHAGRTSRTLHLNRRLTPQHILEGAAKDMAYRSRLAEIRVEISEFDEQLRRLLVAVRDNLEMKFGSDIEAKTKYGRDAFFGSILQSGKNLALRFKEVTDILDSYIKDIDQSNFHFARLGELIKIIYSRENNLNLDKDA